MSEDKPETVSLYQFFERFQNEEASVAYFEKSRWRSESRFGHCGSTNVAPVQEPKADALPLPR